MQPQQHSGAKSVARPGRAGNGLSRKSERGIAAIETKEDRLMLTRNNDYITLAGKFPRLTKQEPKARLNEVRKLLLAL